jgi:hypothetical protein
MNKLQEFRNQVPTENRAIQALRAAQRKLALTTGLPGTTGRSRQDQYGLEPELVTPALQAEMDALWEWMTNPAPQYRDLQNVLAPEIALNRIAVIYRRFGWLVQCKQVPVMSLSLSQLVAFTPIKTAYDACTSFEEHRQIERAAQRVAEHTLQLEQEHLHWQTTERQVHPGTQRFEVEAVIDVAEFLYRDETDRFKGKPYSDVPVMVLLRKQRQSLKKKAKGVPPAADMSLKWLDWDAFVRFVQQLESECLPYYNSGLPRTLSAIARSIRRYLICALLCYLPPDRQRTLRELEVGKTLLQGGFRPDGFFQPSDSGQWYIWLGKGDYKTAATYGESMKQIPALLVPTLEDWLNRWRAVFQPTHNFVFTQENGKPYTKASTFSAIIRNAAYRLTGQLLHSHLIRHMLVTYLKRLKVAPELLQNVALAMHHSSETQDDYDERSVLEQVSPAQQLVLDLARGHLPGAADKELSLEEMAETIRQLPMQDFERLMAMLGRSTDRATMAAGRP